MPRDEESQYRFLSQITYEIVFSCFFVKGGGEERSRERIFETSQAELNFFHNTKNFEKITIGEKKWRTGEMEGTFNNFVVVSFLFPVLLLLF